MGQMVLGADRVCTRAAGWEDGPGWGGSGHRGCMGTHDQPPESQSCLRSSDAHEGLAVGVGVVLATRGVRLVARWGWVAGGLGWVS